MPQTAPQAPLDVASRSPSARARWLRGAALALALAAAPAAAYLPPATAILKRVAQRRDDVGAAALQVGGTLTFSGEAARGAAASGIAATPGAATGADLTVPATLFVKTPGRCRLELSPAGAPTTAADRPAASLRGGRLSGRRGLEALPAVAALVEGVCALIGEKGAGGSEPERAFAQALAARGVALTDVALGRMGGRVAWVIGGRPQDARPQAWIDKQAFQPLRLIARFGDATRDVRLLDFGSPVGGDRFPRAVEIWDGTQLEARFTAERVLANPKLPDAIF
ncbi:MAG: hypothetical protein ACJ79E_17915 [Anaeromyxobacteraceae bacterium]